MSTAPSLREWQIESTLPRHGLSCANILQSKCTKACIGFKIPGRCTSDALMMPGLFIPCVAGLDCWQAGVSRLFSLGLVGVVSKSSPATVFWIPPNVALWGAPARVLPARPVHVRLPKSCFRLPKPCSRRGPVFAPATSPCVFRGMLLE